jgi:hypothetical protein
MDNIDSKDGKLLVKSPPSFRDQPEIEFQHRLNTRAHFKFLQDEKLFDVSDRRWAKATVDGEVCYPCSPCA